MPNLFVIGASKAGTSSLHAYLRVHPEIWMSPVKEPCHFVDQAELEAAWPIMARNPASYDREAYLDLFAPGADRPYRGEGSVYYAQAPHRSGVAARIAQAVPEARIVYVVREPVARTIAHYWQRAKEFQEPLSLDRAIAENPLYRDTSDYALQLEQYRAVFPDPQIHVLTAEDLKMHRRETLARLFEWLGIDAHAYSDEELAERHRSLADSRKARYPFVKAVRDSRIWATARQYLPGSAVGLLRSAGTRRVDRAAVDDGPVRAELAHYFAARQDAIEALLGRELPEWRAVQAGGGR
jgi:hypothetical protein